MEKKDKRFKAIVAVGNDGAMAGYFEKIMDAVRKYGFTAGKLGEAIKTGKVYYGFKWMLDDDYKKLWLEGKTHELAFERTKYNRPMTKGTTPFKPMAEWSDESKRKYRESQSRKAKRLWHDPNCKFGKCVVKKPIVCVNTGVEYPSIKQAARELGIQSHQITGAISRHGTVHGLKFEPLNNKQHGA